MSTELASTYNAAEVEAEIAALWNANHAFHAEPDAGGDPYCIVIPPPNVTAVLHTGHALNNTLQDILIRHHRMRGRNTLWMPGTDHAGIATQTVVEKRVLEEEGKRRTDFERDAFVEKIQAWKDEYEHRITEQLKAMGCSCDWDRQRFTMDDICARAVREAFFRLFKDGLIYRGKRLVNWDPATQTALADDEVENEEVDGHFWYMRYPLEDGSGHVTVATTRPETMLGDTAVAINPNDPRAAELRGKKVRLPIVGRVIPIIEDDYVVLPDPESNDEKAKFASGFLKVTPAHDPNDWDIGQRHGLPVINVMAPDGSISNEHGWEDAGDDAQFLLGMDRYKARKAIVKWFDDNGLLEEVKPYRHSVGHSYRSHVPVEPYLSDQWYVKVTDDKLRGAALRAMSQRDCKAATSGRAPWEGQLTFYPARYANTFRGWHENLRDWCISRQLWWGHRIPVWSRHYATREEYSGAGMYSENAAWQDELSDRLWALQENHAQVHTSFVSDDDPDRNFEETPPRTGSFTVYVCVRNDSNETPDTYELSITELMAKLGFEQDPDVLDTWFSSGLWPISTLGWPQDTAALNKWNPGNVLCTAREIITLWVSRMVMFNIYFRDCLPFTDVFIHAMIQDGEGRKMSKSLGNGVDPLDIIHSHGSDAMRYTLAAMTTDTQDVRMPVVQDPDTGRNTSPKFDVGRNFANKLWNAGRFALSNLESSAGTPDDERSESSGLPDQWILSRLARTITATTTALENYEFNVYAQSLYDFFWRDLCDWYIEAVKPTVKSNPQQQHVLATCLDAALKLLHPVMPFVTEKLWQRLNEIHRISDGDLLVKATWPTAGETDDDAESTFASVQEVVTAIRQVRTQQKTPPRQKVDCSFQGAADCADTFQGHADLLGVLANINLVAAGPDVTQPEGAAVALLGPNKLFLHDLVDTDAEKTRLTKRLEELTNSVKTLEGRLSNKSYTEKAPAHLVQQTRDQLAEAQSEAESVQQQLNAIL